MVLLFHNTLRNSLPFSLDTDKKDAFRQCSHIDNVILSNQDLLSDDIATVRVLGNMRGISVALLEVRAVNYNPVSNKLLVHNDIDIAIDFQAPTAMAPSKQSQKARLWARMPAS